jgi:hypothetical protein
MLVVGVPKGRGASPLPVTRLVSIPVDGEVRFAPGESQVAHIDLRHYLEGVEIALERSDLIIFWSWVAAAPPTGSGSGMFVVPRAAASALQPCDLAPRRIRP